MRYGLGLNDEDVAAELAEVRYAFTSGDYRGYPTIEALISERYYQVEWYALRMIDTLKKKGTK